MTEIEQVLCVCKGNSDRSPMMAGVLQKYLNRAGFSRVLCDSAGVLEIAAKGGSASPFGIFAAKRIGINISNHQRRQVSPQMLEHYDLFVAVDTEVGGLLVTEFGVDPKKIYNAEVPNPWPVNFQADFDRTAETIMSAMYRVVARYFSE
jgi:protein-tyrosine-phosphatase